MEYQTTIAQVATLQGKGLHTGKEVHLICRPAAADSGIRFIRTDLPNCPEIEALVSNVYDISRGTSLKKNQAEVKTVEHLMAALAGLSIDNLLVEIDAEELPILDGSARLYVECLQKAGILTLEKKREYITIQEPMSYKNEDLGIDLQILPAESFSVTVHVDYGTHVLASQQAVLNKISDFYPEIYDCRTFVFLHELEFLMEHQLVKGGDVDNAIVFVDKIPCQKTLDKLAHFFNKSNIEVLENGTLNNIQLRHENEPARHKLLDVVGDLYLLGKPLKGKILARKPGHLANTELAKLIADSYINSHYCSIKKIE